MNYNRFNKENNTNIPTARYKQRTIPYKVGTYSCSLPTVVLGVLIALKHIGMTSMTYGAIIWFSLEVWLCCAAVMLVCFLIFMFFAAFFGGLK